MTRLHSRQFGSALLICCAVFAAPLPAAVVLVDGRNEGGLFSILGTTDTLVGHSPRRARFFQWSAPIAVLY